MTDETTAESSTEETAISLSEMTDIFNDSDESEEAETETTKAESETEGEKGETEEIEATQETEEEETPSSEESKEEVGLKAALVAERQKRQAAEAELKKTQEPEVIPDPIDQPEEYAKYIEDKASKSEVVLKFNLSRSMVMDSKEDYTEMEKVFMGLTEDDDGNVTDMALHNKMLASNNPALFIYNHAKEHLEIEKLRDPKYKETLEAELRAKIAKEAEEAKLKGLTADQVPNLNDATATGNNSQKTEKEITTLDEVF